MVELQNSEETQAQAMRRDWRAPALLFALAFPTLATWLYFIQFAGSLGVRIFYGAGKGVQFAFPVLYVLLLERGTVRPSRPRARMTTRTSIVAGALFGMAVAGTMLVFYSGWLAHTEAFREVPAEVSNKLRDARITSPGGYLGLAVFYSLVHSLLEEYYWRWFVFGRLREVLPRPAAIVISSLGFMAHHTLVIGIYFGAFSTLTVLFSAGVAVGGAIWAWLYDESGRLDGPWLSHLLVDAGIMAIGYQMVW